MKFSGLIVLCSVLGVGYVGFTFWDVSKLIIGILLLFSQLSVLKNKKLNIKSFILSPIAAFFTFLMLPISILSGVALFFVCWLFSGEFKGGFRGLAEIYTKKE